MAHRRVGGYELLRVLGRGGMATVHLARQIELGRDVALKELTVFDTGEPHVARRFLREARLAGSLSHPNIVVVHDYFEQDGTPYIAMEYLARGTLRPYVGGVSLPQLGGVLRGVLGALAHAEGRGVVHRDVKPENVLLTDDGTVKLTDFGIAKATSVTATLTQLTTAGTTLGTPRYMAPERVMGQEVGPWSDLYSVGIMVFELLAGRTPFEDTEAPMDVLMRQINDPVPPLGSVVPGLDPRLADWVARLLVKEPSRRTRTAAQAWQELDPILAASLGPGWERDAPLADRPAPAGRARAAGPAPAPSHDALTVAPATYRLTQEPERRRPARRLPSHRLAVAAAVLLATVTAFAALRPSGHSPAGAPLRAAATAPPLAAPARAAAVRSSAAGDDRQAFADALPRALDELRTRVDAHAAALARGSAPGARASALRDVSRDYGTAAGTVGRPGAMPAAGRRLVVALRGTARAFAGAAVTVARGGSLADPEVGGPIESGEAATARALGALRAAGYDPGASATGMPPAAAAAPDAGSSDTDEDEPDEDEPDEDDDGD
jgi:hypothetical protein